ncbi:MAG: hypothetical protein V4749_09810 [Pseudomonadota bacterium]
MKLSNQEGEVEKRPLFIPPPGYVAGVGELIVLAVGGLVMLWLAFLMLDEVVEVPPAPKALELRRAYITRPLVVSRSAAYIHVKVERREKGYSYVIRMPSNDAQQLNMHKGKQLWVGVGSSNDDQFVWSVYDDGLRLILGHKQRVWQVKYNNGLHYFMFVLWFLGFGFWVLCI